MVFLGDAILITGPSALCVLSLSDFVVFLGDAILITGPSALCVLTLSVLVFFFVFFFAQCHSDHWPQCPLYFDSLILWFFLAMPF